MRKKYIIQLYGGFQFNVVVTKNINEDLTKFKKEIGFHHKTPEHVDGLCLISARTSMTTWVFIHPTASPAIIAHECFHAMSFLMKEIGGILSDDSEESFAYLIEYMVDLTYKAIAQYKP